jgi:hypothetical protein
MYEPPAWACMLFLIGCFLVSTAESTSCNGVLLACNPEILTI